MSDLNVDEAVDRLAEEIFSRPQAKIKKKPGRPKKSIGEIKEQEPIEGMHEAAGIPEEVRVALEGYIDLLESNIMDLAEVIADKTVKMEELRKKRDVVKKFMGENNEQE